MTDILRNPSDAYKKTYVESLAKKGYNSDQLNEYVNEIEQTRSYVDQKYNLLPAKAGQKELERLADEELKQENAPLGFGGNYDPFVPIWSWWKDFANKTGETALQGLDKAQKGVGQMIGALGSPAADVSDVSSELTGGALKTATGAAHTAFNVIPQAIVFNASMDAINTTAKKNLSEEDAATVEKVTSLPFTIASSTAQAIGITPEMLIGGAPGSTKEMVEMTKGDHESKSGMFMELIDLVIAGKAMHAASTGNLPMANKIKSAKDLQDIIKDAAENKLSPEEMSELKTFSDELQNTSMNDIKSAAEASDKPEAKEVLAKINEFEDKNIPNNELHTKLAELQSKVNDPSFQELPPEAREAIANDITATQNEISAKENERMDIHFQEAQSLAKVAELDDKITQLIGSLEGQPEAVKESIQKTIDNLTQERDALQKQSPTGVLQSSQEGIGETGGERGSLEQGVKRTPFAEKSKEEYDAEKARVIDFKITEEIQNGEIEPGTVQEKVAREALSKRYDNIADLEKDAQAMYKADEVDIAEAFSEPAEEAGVFTYKTGKNTYTAKVEGGELKILDKDGNEPSLNTKLKITKDYEQKFDYKKGKSAFEGVKEGEILPEEADKLVSEKSENPAEIIESHERLLAETPFEKGEATDNAIAENIGKVKQSGRGGYNNFGDRNNVTQSKAKSYFSESKGEEIDTLAQRISEDTGIEVTPDDIVSFIDRYPNRISDYTKSLKNPLITTLKDRFKKVTGLTLNNRVLRAYDRQKLAKEEYELINQDFENYEQARKSFQEALDRGEIKEPVVSGEEAIVLENEGREGIQGKESGISEPVSQGIDGKISESNRRNEEVASELRRRSRETQEDGGGGQREKENKIAYDYAQETGTWIDSIYDKGEKFESGNENTNAINANEGRVYKANNLMNTMSFDGFFDKIALHNKLFPNTKLTFEGFTGFNLRGKPYVEPVYSQEFISGAKYATEAEIAGYMQNLGFDKVTDSKFINGEIEVSDLHPRNVLVDKNGNIHVIDAEFKRNEISDSGSGTGKVKESTTKGEPPKGKKLKLGERILDSENIDPEIKAGLEKKGIDYIPIDLDVTQAKAKDYVDAFVKADQLDKAISNVTDMSNGMSGVNRGAIGKELFEVLADNAAKAETLAEKKKWQDKAVDIARFTAENFKAAGQEINAAKAWKRMLERTPEGAIASIKKGMEEKNEATLKKHKKEITDAKEIIDEFIKSEEFSKIVGEKVAAEIQKLGKKSPKKENIFNSKKVREDRLAELRERAKKAKGSASSSIVGLNKEQIEIYGEMGVIYLIEGAYHFKKWANKMLKENPDFTQQQLQDIWDKVKVGPEYDPQQRTLADFAKTGLFEMMPPEVKKEFLDKWDKKLKRLSPESRKKLLGNAMDEIQKLGGLSNERFKEMYAQELGLPGVDTIAEQKIRSLIDTINKADKTGKELQDLFDKDASKDEIKAKQKEWVNDVFNGQKANAELSDYFKNEKTIGNTLSTILQGNLLGPMSLVKNIYSNTLIQPLRFLSRGTSSALDYTMSKAAMLPVLKNLISKDRTIDALAYWRGESKGVLPGLKTSAKELIKGINPEEMIERDLSQNLQPLKSMVDFYAGLKGEKKQSAYQQINNFAEATFGVPAEVMFRLLNLGDKPFRKAAEMGAAYEIGKLKGLEGKELDKFALFPDAESAELIKKRSETAVYQQVEGLAKVTQQGIKAVEKYLADVPYVGDVLQVIHKSQIPYVKTPLNILGETFTYTFPEYAALRGTYEALKGNRRESLEYFGKAIVGAGIRFTANQLIQNGLLTGSNDRKDVEGSQIQYQNIPPNSMNITALQRMVNGGNPKIQDDDVWINYSNMGVLGMLLGVHSNQKEMMDTGYLEELGGSISYTAKAAIEQSFLSGANTALEALTGDDRSKRKWEINTLGALASIFYPNTLANISKAKDDTSRVTKADLFSDELANTFKTKMFMGHQLPSKVNLWGETIHQVPEGKNKYVWYLLDVTKAKPVDTESFNYKIYDLWNKLPEEDKSKALPSIPRNYFMLKKQKVMLDPALYETYQKYTGKNRAVLVEKYVKSENWTKDADEKKLEKLKKIYETGADSAKKKLILEHPELKPNR